MKASPNNPIRYRGYYYDVETGLYYLQSRYYDPQTGRFINADDTDYLGADGSFASYNLFAYCNNNPVMNVYPSGCLKASISHISKNKYKATIKLTNSDIKKIKFGINSFMIVFDAICGIIAVVGGIPTLGISVLAATIEGIVVSAVCGLTLAYIDYKDNGKGAKITFSFKCGVYTRYRTFYRFSGWKLKKKVRKVVIPYAYITSTPKLTWNK